MKNIFRREVDRFAIKDYLYQHLKSFIKNSDTGIIIHYDVTKRGVVNLYTNRPGIIIGKGGKTIDEITLILKNKCNVKDVRVYEMKNIISNCGIY